MSTLENLFGYDDTASRRDWGQRALDAGFSWAPGCVSVDGLVCVAMTSRGPVFAESAGPNENYIYDAGRHTHELPDLEHAGTRGLFEEWVAASRG